MGPGKHIRSAATKKKQSDAAKRRWQRPEERNKLILTARRRLPRKDTALVCQRKKFAALHKVPMPAVHRQALRDAVRPKLSEATKQKIRDAWKRPGHAKRILSASMSGASARPNKFELKCLSVLSDTYDLAGFVYCGNGDMMVNGRSADAYSEELNTIALIHGVYWHLRKFGLDITEENKRAVEKVDSLPFLSAGYKVIFIWEDELDKIVQY